MGKTPDHPDHSPTKPMTMTSSPTTTFQESEIIWANFTDCISAPQRRRPIDCADILCDFYFSLCTADRVWSDNPANAEQKEDWDRLDEWYGDLAGHIGPIPYGCTHERPGLFEYMGESIVAVGKHRRYIWRVELTDNGTSDRSQFFSSLENACMFIQGFKYKAQRH